MRSTNYPVRHPVSPGAYSIEKGDCGSYSTIATGEASSLIPNPTVDMSMFASKEISLDGLYIPELSGSQSSNIRPPYYCSAKGGNAIVLGGDNGIITLTLNNGISWKTIETGIPQTFRDVVFAQNQFVFVATGGYVVRLIDEDAFITQRMGTTTIYSIAFAAGGAASNRYLICSQETFYITPDFSYIIEIANPGSAIPYGAAYGADGFIVSYSDGTIARSIYGNLGWTAKSIVNFRGLLSIFYDGTNYNIVGSSGVYFQAPTYDSEWTLIEFNTGILRDIIYDGTKFYLCGDNGTVGYGPGAPFTFQNIGSDSFRTIVSNGSVVIVAGLGANVYMSTDNGNTFTEVVEYGDSLNDAGLVKDFRINNNAAIYTFAYDYNTRHISNIGIQRLNNDPIAPEIVPGQYLSLSFYDEACSNNKLIEISKNGESQRVLNTTLRSAQYLVRAGQFEVLEGDTIDMTVTPTGGPASTLTYHVVQQCHRYVLYYVNKFGAIDSLVMKGCHTESYVNDRFVINTFYDRLDPMSHQYRNQQNTALKYLSLNTGDLTNAQSQKNGSCPLISKGVVA